MGKVYSYAKTVRELLSGQKYGIDYYQREYKWEKKHVLELLADLTGRFMRDWNRRHERREVENYGHYFLGSIVISQKKNRNYLIDGQQRLTTLTLVFIYLRNHPKNKDDRANLGGLISSTRFGKLSFNLDVEERRSCMRALYERQSFDPSNKSESVRNIASRYQDIEENLPEQLEDDALPYFTDWLLENVHLVEITTDSDEDAYTIFETTNDRGLSLSLPDMLKGYLLSSIVGEGQKDEANALWRKRVHELAKLDQDEEVEFFKNWFRAKYARDIRKRKAKAAPKDFERIGTGFHRWVRRHNELLGLHRSADFVEFIHRDFDFFSRQYLYLSEAYVTITSGLESIFYNADRVFTLQDQVLLAPLTVNDSSEVIDRKLALVADYLDIYLARRVWNFRAITYSNQLYAMFVLTREIRDKEVPELSAVLRQRLDEQEERFQTEDRFRRHQQNQRQVHHILARITHYIERESGLSTSFNSYVDRTIDKPFEIEHIWADDYSRHKDEFSHSADFQEYRERISGLLLLPRGFNQSYGAMAYEEKVEHYNAQNLLARSLHPACYRRNPGFKSFMEQSALPFKPHAYFKCGDIDERYDLYRKIAEEIWNPNRLRA